MAAQLSYQGNHLKFARWSGLQTVADGW